MFIDFRERSAFVITKAKSKVKCTLVQALRLCIGRTVYRGSRTIVTNGTRRSKGSASRPGSSLPPGKSRYPLYRRLDGPQGRSGHMRKISAPPGFDPRTVQPVASRYADYATRPTVITNTWFETPKKKLMSWKKNQ